MFKVNYAYLILKKDHVKLTRQLFPSPGCGQNGMQYMIWPKDHFNGGFDKLHCKNPKCCHLLFAWLKYHEMWYASKMSHIVYVLTFPWFYVVEA